MTFDSLVNMPIFDVFGVPAVLSFGENITLETVAIDRTKGVEVEDLSVGVISVRPVAAIRAASLAGLDLVEIEQGTITLNGSTWRIKAVMERPTPFGAADGQLWLILLETTAAESISFVSFIPSGSDGLLTSDGNAFRARE